MNFVNKIELSDQKYQNNVNVRYESYKGNFLYTMKEFVSSLTYHQSMYFMSNIFLKDKIDGVRVTQFQLAYIRNTTHNSHKNLVTLCCEVNYMWRGNQDLEMQEWEDCTNPNKTRMIAIIMLVTKNNPQRYK